MPSKSIKCCVKGCTATGVSNHRFPNPNNRLDLFNRWLDILNDEDLRVLNPVAVYQRARVCSAHFDPKYIAGSKYLYKHAIPFKEVLVAAEKVEPSSSRTANIEERMERKMKTRKNVLEETSGILSKTNIKLYKNASRATSSMKSFKQRLTEAKKFNRTKMPFMSSAAHNFFFKLQRRQTTKQAFTTKEKILALTLYKNSPKNYSILCKLFALPSRKTLKHFLQQLTLQSGVNVQLFEALKQKVSKLNAIDRYCVLLFDEVRLTPHLDYNSSEDLVEGFVDTGLRRHADYADRALVFMVRGVTKQYKQPIAFSFCKGSTKGALLAPIIKQIISKLIGINLKVIGSVCDQKATNQAALNILMKDTAANCARMQKEWRGGYFEVGNSRIIPMFDVPHLMKGIRNHFVRKHLTCQIGGRTLTGRWEHVVQVYEFDSATSKMEELRLLPRLTERHVRPNSKDKMKVTYATQVFSQRVAAIMRHMAMTDTQRIPRNAEETSLILMFFDKLFDSLNSSSLDGISVKPYTSALTSKSEHMRFWDDALATLKTMKFIDVENGQEDVPPSVTNFIKTIEAVKLLWAKLRKVSVKFVLLRNLNQDPLENFFGVIKSQGIPSATNFIEIFKSLTLNNFTRHHSISFNCEEDATEGALSTLRELLVDQDEAIDPEDVFIYKKSTYVTAYTLKSLNIYAKECENCRSTFINVNYGLQHSLNNGREYSYNKNVRVLQCSAFFITIKKITINFLKSNLEAKNICRKIYSEVLKNVD